MQVNIYVKDQLYKTLDVPGDQYEVGKLIKLVHGDRDAGLIPDYVEGEKLPIRIETVR